MSDRPPAFVVLASSALWLGAFALAWVLVFAEHAVNELLSER